MLSARRKNTHNSNNLNRTLNKRLRIESLERKVMLAGDVMAQLVGGDLVLTGDLDDNSFSLRRDNSLANPGVGDLVVVGFNGTTINGVPADINGLSEVPFSITGDVIANLGQGGQDFAGIGTNQFSPFGRLELPGSVIADGGIGDVSLSLNDVGVVGDVTYSDSPGALQSSVLANNSAIGGDFVSVSHAISNEIGASETGIGGEMIIGGDMIFLVDNPTSESFVTNRLANIGDDFRFESNAAATTTRHEGSTVGDDLIIITGGGEDFIELSQDSQTDDINTIGDDLRIKTGDATDEVILIGVEVGDDVVLNVGDGDDIVEIDAGDDDNLVGDDLYVSGKGGNDEIVVAGTDIGDKLRVSGSGGDDFVEVTQVIVGRTALISLGSGSNEADVSDLTGARGLTVLGRGENIVSIQDTTTTHYVDVLTSSGDDMVTLFNVNTHSVWVATYAGVDEVSIEESIVDYLFVFLGSGDDTLTLDNVTVNRLAVLSGGSGTDTLVDVDDASDINFEIDFAFENYQT